jgi:hypothetical protein
MEHTMSEESFSEVEHTGCLSRLVASIKGVFVGIILVVLAFPVLFWNEGRAVNTWKGLQEGAAAVVDATADEVDSGNEGKLVHVTGEMASTEELADAVFAVTVSAIQLERKAEMYQWEENKKTKTEKKMGGGEKKVTSYSYKKGWSSTVKDSSNFKKQKDHVNPGSMLYQGKSFVAKKVNLGAFELSESLISQYSEWEDLSLNSDHLTNLSEDLQASAKIAGGGIYIGADPASPAIGDMRVTFRQVLPGTASVIAKQTGKSLSSYKTAADTTLAILTAGTHSSEDMFDAAEAANAMMTWILRLVGFLMMFIGFGMVFKPFTVLADTIPFVGAIFQVGAGLIAALLAFPATFMTIAIAWIFYRPLLGIILLVLGMMFFIGFLVIGLALGTMIAKRKAAAA